MLIFKIIIIIIIILLIIFTILNINLILSNTCEMFLNKNPLNQNYIINNNELHKSKYYGLKSGKNEKSLIGKINKYTKKYTI